MASAMGIVLTGTAIGVGNEFMQGYGLNFRMGMAGLGAALFIGGIQKVNDQAGVGLAAIVFITMMLTPFKGKSPAQELEALLGQKAAPPQRITDAAQLGQPSKSGVIIA
jgi:hypothetical protein